MNDAVTRLLPARRGHFLLESGHHGDLWLELEKLFLRPEAVHDLAAQFGARIGRAHSTPYGRTIS